MLLWITEISKAKESFLQAKNQICTTLRLFDTAVGWGRSPAQTKRTKLGLIYQIPVRFLSTRFVYYQGSNGIFCPCWLLKRRSWGTGAPAMTPLPRAMAIASPYTRGCKARQSACSFLQALPWRIAATRSLGTPVLCHDRGKK